MKSDHSVHISFITSSVLRPDLDRGLVIQSRGYWFAEEQVLGIIQFP